MYIPVLVLFSILLFFLPYKAELSTPPLGNYLQGYFYYRASNNVTAQDPYVYLRLMRGKAKNSELDNLYKKLPWRVAPTKIDFNSRWDTAWQPTDGHKPVANYLQFWQQVRPIAKQIYDSTLPFVNIDKPVIHFRCSDIPFIKHAMYHLTKRQTVRWMAKQIKSQGYTHAVLLNCAKNHYARDQDSCNQYAEYYAAIFATEGVQISQQCLSELGDFSTMYHSPLLVSLNPSSFSFMAGIAKDPTTYISCNMGQETPSGYTLMTDNQADWRISTDAPLLHKEVESYTNPIAVIQQLAS